MKEKARAQSDALTRATITVAWVIVANKPFYPVYVWYLVGSGVTASLLTLVCAPLFLAIPFVARRSPLGARIMLPLVGAFDTLFETKLFGSTSGTELFFAACVMLAALSFRAEEQWYQRGLVALVFGAFLISRNWIGAPLHEWTDDELSALLNLNAYALASLLAFIGLRYAGINRTGEPDSTHRGKDMRGSQQEDCMRTYFTSLIVLVATCFLAAGATSHAVAAPKVVEVGPDHYRGTWLEIGRTPMFLTDGCVAGYSTYRKGKTPDKVLVEDGCRVGTPEGRLKTVNGTGKIQDFGTTNAKMRVRYPLLITFNFWVLYKSPDKSWFISANPSMSDLWIYSRTVPSKTKLQRMIRKASELGYDVRKLEFPDH